MASTYDGLATDLLRRSLDLKYWGGGTKSAGAKLKF
jgi:hypothetical protein